MPRKALLAEVDFVTARTGFALGQNGRMWVTRDRGEHWHDLPGIGTDDGIGMSFSDRAARLPGAVALGDDARGYVLRTSDGGRTWRPQLLTGSPMPRTASRRPAAASTSRSPTARRCCSPSAAATPGGDRRVRITGPPRRAPRRTLRLRGRLAGAAPGTEVLVSRRQRGESVWDSRSRWCDRTAASRPRGSWPRRPPSSPSGPGDEDQAGDGSAPRVVRALRRR